MVRWVLGYWTQDLSKICPGPVQDLSRTFGWPAIPVRHPVVQTLKKPARDRRQNILGRARPKINSLSSRSTFLRFRGRDGGLGWRPGMAAWRAAYRISLVFGSALFEFTGTPRPSTIRSPARTVPWYTCTRNHRHTYVRAHVYLVQHTHGTYNAHTYIIHTRVPYAAQSGGAASRDERISHCVDKVGGTLTAAIVFNGEARQIAQHVNVACCVFR